MGTFTPHHYFSFIVSSCNDGLQNGDEEGVDCGGSGGCDPCVTCFDGIQNGDEEGVDCGGTGGCSECVPDPIYNDLPSDTSNSYDYEDYGGKLIIQAFTY